MLRADLTTIVLFEHFQSENCQLKWMKFSIQSICVLESL